MRETGAFEWEMRKNFSHEKNVCGNIKLLPENPISIKFDYRAKRENSIRCEPCFVSEGMNEKNWTIFLRLKNFSFRMRMYKKNRHLNNVLFIF